MIYPTGLLREKREENQTCWLALRTGAGIIWCEIGGECEYNSQAGVFLRRSVKLPLEAVKYKMQWSPTIAYRQGIVIFRNQSILPEAPQTFEEYLEEARNKTRGDIVGAVIDLGLLVNLEPIWLLVKGDWWMRKELRLFDSAPGLCWMSFLKHPGVWITGWDEYESGPGAVSNWGKVVLSLPEPGMLPA